MGRLPRRSCSSWCASNDAIPRAKWTFVMERAMRIALALVMVAATVAAQTPTPASTIAVIPRPTTPGRPSHGRSTRRARGRATPSTPACRRRSPPARSPRGVDRCSTGRSRACPARCSGSRVPGTPAATMYRKASVMVNACVLWCKVTAAVNPPRFLSRRPTAGGALVAWDAPRKRDH